MDKNALRCLVGLAIIVLASGCSRGIHSAPGNSPNLEEWARQVETRPAPDLEPLPVLQTFEPVAYVAAERDPFSPSRGLADASSVRPDAARPRQPLEEFPLDGLKMVGTIGSGASITALIQSPDNVVYRVRVGQYLGQNDGRVVSIAEDSVQLVELVSDGSGGWEERPAAVAMSQ